MRNFFRSAGFYALALLVGITLLTAWIIGYGWVTAGAFVWMTPGSQLAAFEMPITGPADELMEESPELHANFERFQECYRKSADCDATAILAERDRLVRKHWPATYRNLAHRQDWATCTDPTAHCDDIPAQHDDFEAARAIAGDFALEYKCLPVVEYKAKQDGFGDSTLRPVYQTRGYRCGDVVLPQDWDYAKPSGRAVIATHLTRLVGR